MLINLLHAGGAVRAQGMGEPTLDICADALTEGELPGGIPSLIRQLQNTGRALRQRFARDFWLIASRPMPALRDHHPRPCWR
jgi:uncharacterized alpha-E superfamily protein